jgi:hypothetical protein
MNSKNIHFAKTVDLIISIEAMREASIVARKLAIETNTAIVVYRDGRVVRRVAKELRNEITQAA